MARRPRGGLQTPHEVKRQGESTNVDATSRFEYAEESHWRLESIQVHCFFWGFPFSERGTRSELHARCRLLAICVSWSRESGQVEVTPVCMFAVNSLTGSMACATLDGPGSAASGARVHKVIDMVAHCDEQVEEQLSPHLHFHLHCTTTLECLPAANNEGEVMRA